MSASTRTIQQPASTGSITTALAMGLIALAVALAISWGATNVVGEGGAAQAAQAPTVLDRGSRFESLPQAGPAAASILDRGGRGDGPSTGSLQAGRHLAPRAQ